jgi:hypothetical protein
MVRFSILALALAACGSHGASRAQPDGDAIVPPQGCDAKDDDGDGWSNAVETAMGTSPTDPNDNPDTRHMTVFDVPYHGMPRPATHDTVAPARVARADVAILLDTSGSMLGTDTRIQAQFQTLVTMLAGQIDDLAFGAGGIGDFPINDGANSQYDVPYYLVHRIMTARTQAGIKNIVDSFVFKNIITSGLGPWFAGMRGGDEPEQGWEALRQGATGVGITFPNAYGTGTESVPPFSAQTAYPAHAPAGEEVGTLGGMGFRTGSLPIFIMITDTTQHDEVLTTTTPHSANLATATMAVQALGARVIGVSTYLGTGQPDLAAIATATGAQVTPDAWGTGSDRPANCPVGRCCLVADDPSLAGTTTQPAPVNGECTLVFHSDRYDTNLAKMLAQGITGVARGVRFAASATLVDDPGDAVDAPAAFVDHVEAIADGSCSGASVRDVNGDGVPDTFDAVVPGTNVCFRITAKNNETVMPAQGPVKYHAVLQLTGDGVPYLAPVDVWFVVPADSCDPVVVAR